MAFLNPILLAGMAAVSIPIIIHLLNRRKFDRVVWGAMRFLLVSVQKNQRRLQIEDLLLLILRCVMLMLLALCLARPAIKSVSSGFFGQAKITAVMVLDNSYSMSQNNGVDSRFDRAKAALEAAMATLPNGSSVAVILASDVSEQVIPEPTYDLALARKTVQEARLCDRSTNLLRSITDSLDILKRSGSIRQELYLATDGQLAGFQQIDEMCKALDEAKNHVHAHILLAGQAETQNLCVSDVKLGSDIPAVGLLHGFEVQITNYGHEEATGVRVQLHMDDEPPSAEGTIDRIAPGGAQTISLAAKIRSEGYHTVTASIPADRLPADDRRTMALKGIGQVNVLLVDGNPGLETRDSEVFYLRHALVPAPRAEADQYLVKATTVQAADLAEQKFDQYQIVALADVADLSSKTVDDLAGFVRRGGGLLIFPGDDTNAGFYNNNLLAGRGLLPAELGKTDGDASQQTRFAHLAGQGLAHPIVQVWNDPQSGNIAEAHFYKRYLLKAAGKASGPAAVDAGEPRVVLSFSDGAPFMVERAFGEGRVFLFASTASTRWNNLPDHPGIFVPLMYRTVGWSLLQQNRQLNIKVGEKFVFHPPLEELSHEATITRPGSAGDTTHDSRRVEMDERQLPTLVYDDTGVAGEYQAVFGHDKPVKFAAQSDPGESSLEDISDAQRGRLGASAVVLDWKPGLDLKTMLARERVGTELWFPLAVIVLMLATAETFLADWFSRAK